MPTRITCRNKWMEDRQTIDDKGFILPLVGNPKASYTVNKANPRILCGSI
jgi:hypothetical protein